MMERCETGPQPAVSVVIATYNRASLLPETLESIFKQTFRDFEVIVVDDGSSDQTGEVLASYEDRIRLFRQENRGPSAARNLGIAHARGRWIAIQDSDDLAAPGQLEILSGFMRDHPDVQAVFANGAYLGGPEHQRDTIIPPGKSRRLAREGVALRDFFDKSIFRFQAALVSKQAILGLGGLDESLRICMDLDFSFRLFMTYPMAYLDRVVFYYRKHEGNIGRNEERRLSENIQVINKLVAEHPEANNLLGRGRIARRIAYRYYRLAKGRRRDGDREAVKEAIRHAVSLRPLSLKYRFYQLKWT